MGAVAYVYGRGVGGGEHTHVYVGERKVLLDIVCNGRGQTGVSDTPCEKVFR